MDDIQAEDEAFCQQLHAQYEADPDKGSFLTEDEVCQELGITIQ